MVADLVAIENTLVRRLDASGQGRSCGTGKPWHNGDLRKSISHHLHVVLGPQVLRPSPRIRDQFSIVERLGGPLRSVDGISVQTAGLRRKLVELKEHRRLLSVHPLVARNRGPLPGDLACDGLGPVMSADATALIGTCFTVATWPYCLHDSAVSQSERAGQQLVGRLHEPGDLESRLDTIISVGVCTRPAGVFV